MINKETALGPQEKGTTAGSLRGKAMGVLGCREVSHQCDWSTGSKGEGRDVGDEVPRGGEGARLGEAKTHKL